jgi:hypothetical protein
MLSQRVEQLLGPYDSLSRLVVACGIATLLGVAALWLSPLWVLAGMLGMLILAAIAYRPELGLLAILVVTSGLVNAARLPALKLGAISLHIPDLILLYLLALVLTKVLVVPGFKVVRTPLDIPLTWFYFAILLSVALAITRSSLDMNFVLRRFRPLTYWLIFFAVTNLVRTRSQLVRLVRGVFCVGLLIAGTMVIQASLGPSVLIMGGWILKAEEGLIRFFHPGALIVYIVLITLICDMAVRRHEKYRLLRALQAIVLGAGLLATLTRHPLVSAIMSLAILVFILRRFELSRLARNLLLTAVIALVIIGALAISGRESLILEYSTVYIGRLQSMFSARILTPDENLVPRWMEIRYAWPHIVENPIFGIGLGSPYRPRLYEGEVIAYYIHNAYLWIWLAAGLFGLIPFLWLSVRFLRRGLRYWRNVQDHFLRSVTLGFTLAYLGMMISNLVAPSFLQDWGMAVFGVILGINESILIHNEAHDERYQEGEFT